MTASACLVALILATAYRIWVPLVRLPTAWRASFSLTIFLVAIGVTGWIFRYPCDMAFGIPNLTYLLSHLALIAAGCAGHIFVDISRYSILRPRAMAWHIGLAFLTCLFLIATWFAAPWHESFVLDPVTLAGDWAVAANLALFYGYIGLSVFALGWHCAHQPWRDIVRRLDSLLTLSLMIIGCGIAGIVLILHGVATISVGILGVHLPVTSAVGVYLLPWGAMAIALSAFIFVIVGPIARAATMVNNIRVLGPLWRHLAEMTPQVILPPPHLKHFRHRLAFREHRLFTEIQDALYYVSVSVPSRNELDSLAAALKQKRRGIVAAADILTAMNLSGDDRRQIFRLARAFNGLIITD